MNNEIERYVGELRELREKVKFLNDKRDFIRNRIDWLDSDISMGVSSDWDKQNKKEMKEFLEALI